MKAAICERYDKNSTLLAVKDIETPKPDKDEVLIRIKTAGVNPLDNMIIHGEVKLIVPYKMPLVMGNEFAGVIEDKGENVKDFEVGDRVYGRVPLSKIGAFAEYAAVKQTAVAKVPDYLSDDEAATVPLTALTALQALELMQVKAGEKIFISGGTGSLGAMAIPIASRMGLSVATNGNGENEERVKRLGAEQFIDYKKQDYKDVLSDMDYVLDTLGDRELEKEFGVLKEGGSLVSLRGLPNGEFAKRMGMNPIKQMMFSFAGRKYDSLAARKHQKYHFIFVHEDGAGLQKISDLFGEEKIEASVDEIFGLDDVNAALAKVASGRSKGKTILHIN